MHATQQVADSSTLLLRVEEAGARLGIARTSMFNLLATGQIESVQVGRLRRIPVACLQEYVDRLRQEQAADADAGGSAVPATEHDG